MMDADLSASGSSMISTFAATLSVGDEAEESESESCVTPLSKAPRLTSMPVRGCGKSGGMFNKSWNIPFLTPTIARKERGSLFVPYVLVIFLSLIKY